MAACGKAKVAGRYGVIPVVSPATGAYYVNGSGGICTVNLVVHGSAVARYAQFETVYTAILHVDGVDEPLAVGRIADIRRAFDVYPAAVVVAVVSTIVAASLILGRGVVPGNLGASKVEVEERKLKRCGLLEDVGALEGACLRYLYVDTLGDGAAAVVNYRRSFGYSADSSVVVYVGHSVVIRPPGIIGTRYIVGVTRHG